MRNIEVSDEREPVIVHYDIELDDAGLDPYSFRIYARIVRRCAGAGSGKCSESLQSMADSCQMSRAAVGRAIRVLVKRKMVARKSRVGQTSYYALIDKKHWIDLPENDDNDKPTRLPQRQDPAPTETGVSPTETGPGSHRDTKNTREHKEEKMPVVDGLGDALAEMYPGYAENWKVMRELASLVFRLKAGTSDVRRFPDWLKQHHPMKANTPFAFRDLFHESVKKVQATSRPAVSKMPDWYREIYDASAR